MSWFNEQIRQRKQSDRETFADSFVNIAGAVMGRKVQVALSDDRQVTKDAVDEILKFYHIKTQEVPDSIKDVNEQIEFLLRPHGIMRRTVKLTKGWHKDAIGAMIGLRKSDGRIVAFIPTGISGYSYIDPDTGKRVGINGRTEELFEEDAMVFYKPFPLKKLDIKGLLVYIVQALSMADFFLVAGSALAVTLVGLLTPKINNIIFSYVVESGSVQVLAAIAIFSAAVLISSHLLTIIKEIVSSRIVTKMNITVQVATMMRVLSLPAKFFKDYSAGELSSRTQIINQLCEMLVTNVLQTGLTSIFSLIYISQIFAYAPALVFPAILVIVATVVFSLIVALMQMKITIKQMKLSSKESGLTFALLFGIQKIKLSGAEKRAFARWAEKYSQQAQLIYNPPLLIKINKVITTMITLSGTIAMYYFAVVSHVSTADYFAFNTAYGMVSGAFMGLAGVALDIAKIKPVMNMVKPILEAVPEISEGKSVVTRLSGGIEVSNVTFGYDESMPPILNDISLKIKPGQYVAIVGTTGCGKSTLMRIMLGFETPKKGSVYFDGKDLSNLDLKSLRKKIGVVMQNGKLFEGDLYSNITISAPELTMDDAWEAAELSGMADDIRHMPMGMQTIVSEGGGGISGGQRQRLMISRAIAPKPRILMFDEATSALDNLTQKKVSESLDNLKCTRIVIAHRLSTIRQCDRIIVLDKGKIIEDGTYDELIAQEGFFAELVERQRLDKKEA